MTDKRSQGPKPQGYMGQFRSTAAARMAAGPKRAPGRFVVAMSRGTPETATSTPVRSLVYFRRMNDKTPAKVFSLP
jgi:hypothetical protein